MSSKIIGAGVAWASIVASRLLQEATPIDWTTLSRLLPEAGVVGFFMWFTLKRDAAWAAAAEKREKLWSETLEKRDERWRTFLHEERERDRESLGRSMESTSENLKKVAEKLASLAAIFSQHDVAERVFWEYAKNTWGTYSKEK